MKALDSSFQDMCGEQGSGSTFTQQIFRLQINILGTIMSRLEHMSSEVNPPTDENFDSSASIQPNEEIKQRVSSSGSYSSASERLSKSSCSASLSSHAQVRNLLIIP